MQNLWFLSDRSFLSITCISIEWSTLTVEKENCSHPSIWQKFAFGELDSLGTTDCKDSNHVRAHEFMQKRGNHCISS